MDALTLPPTPLHYPQRHGLNCGNDDRARLGCPLRVVSKSMGGALAPKFFDSFSMRRKISDWGLVLLFLIGGEASDVSLSSRQNKTGRRTEVKHQRRFGT